MGLLTEEQSIILDDDFIEEYCDCDASNEDQHIGPYCRKWHTLDKLPNCRLKNISESYYCPNTIPSKSGKELGTTNEKVCNKSNCE